MDSNRSGNPFRASRLRPGVIPFLSPSGLGLDLQQLTDRLIAQRGRGQIVGPHGTGKSTLWSQLIRRLTERNYGVVSHTCTHNRVPEIDTGSMKTGTILAIDGFEQLALAKRLALYQRTWWCSNGLLITTHQRRIGVPVLIRTHNDPQTLRFVVEQLWRDEFDDRPLPSQLDVTHLSTILRERGNIREALFALYDWFDDWDRNS